jgi:hypothetical protein
LYSKKGSSKFGLNAWYLTAVWSQTELSRKNFTLILGACGQHSAFESSLATSPLRTSNIRLQPKQAITPTSREAQRRLLISITDLFST